MGMSIECPANDIAHRSRICESREVDKCKLKSGRKWTNGRKIRLFVFQEERQKLGSFLFLFCHVKPEY